MVNGVATGTRHIGKRVLGAPDVRAIHVFGVAAQAIFENRLRSHQRERSGNGGLTAACFYVALCRSVASFATGALRRLFAGRNAPVMSIPEEVLPDIGVAGPQTLLPT